MPDAGDILDGYRLDAVIGRGGMGTVYRATDLALEKTVALKIIAPHLADDATFVRRFHEEAKALARLDADGIVDVYTMRETEDALFFVMEYIEGPSLKTVLQRRCRLEPPQAVCLLRQVLAAVEHAHESGVLHRDLKPSNILFDANGRAVITDFGLAKIFASDAELTATHEQLGTVAYMSPEQIEGLQNVDAASDLFAIGLIAYEVFTGQLPFDRSQSNFAVQQALVDASFPPPSTHAPGIPPAVEQVVLDLLSKDPADRPPDAKAALNRLPASSATEDASILEAGTSSRPGGGFTTWQWTALAGMALLVVVGTYVGVRATLGLPILSVSGPTSPEPPSVIDASTTSPQQERVADDSGETTPANRRDQQTEESTPPTSSANTEPASETSKSSASSTNNAKDTAPSEEVKPQRSSEPTFGTLVVRSTPDGATVRLGDSTVGRTPLAVDNLTPGSYRLVLNRDDYRSSPTTVEVSGNDTSTVSPTLSPQPAVVRLGVRPEGEIRIDGDRRTLSGEGLVVDSLSAGPYQITVSSDLGRWETELTLEPGETFEQIVDFSQQVESAVTARTTDGAPIPNATIEVDGETMGYTPQRLALRVGERTIKVTKEGYRPAERTIRVDPEMETPLVFELKEERE